MVDLLIENGHILTMTGRGVGLIENGSIAIEAGKIARVGKWHEVSRTCGGSERKIDATGKVVMPGLVDAHIHSRLALLRGEAQDVPETEWMIKTVAPLAKYIDEDSAVKGSALGALEGVKSGTTLFGDYGPNMDRTLREVYSQIGVRANVCSPINEISSLSGQDANKLYEFDSNVGEQKLKENLRLTQTWHNALDGRVTCCLGPHAADMMSTELLLRVRDIAEEKGLMMHFHLAQGGRENTQIRLRYGKSTVRYLDEIDFLGPKLMGVHCHGASMDELRIIAERGVRMIGCPSSIALIDGIVSPLHAYLEAGGRSAALGSDQACGNNCHNMFSEMKIAALLNKVRENDPTVLPSWRILRLATVEGAETLGLREKVGSLEPGKEADIILVDLKKPHLTPLLSRPVRNLAPNLVYSARGSEVVTTIVGGQIIMDQGKVLTVEEDRILEDAQRAAERVTSRAEKEFFAARSRLAQDMREGLL